MDLIKLFNEINPDVKESTNNAYIVKLRKVYDDKPVLNFNLLLDSEYVKNFLNQEKFKTTNTKRSYLTPIILILRLKHPDSEALQIYEKLNKEYKLSYETNINNKTEDEKKKWLDWSEVEKIRNGYLTDIAHFKDQTFLKNGLEKKALDNALIASIFSYIPPARLDYVDMVVYKNKILADLPKDTNYLLLNKKETWKIILNVYKTEKSYGQKIIIIPPKLKKVIKLYLKFNTKILDGMTENNLSKKIKLIFGANLNILRHSYISSNVDIKTLNKNKEISESMMHSPAMQKGYIRID